MLIRGRPPFRWLMFLVWFLFFSLRPGVPFGHLWFGNPCLMRRMFPSQGVLAFLLLVIFRVFSHQTIMITIFRERIWRRPPLFVVCLFLGLSGFGVLLVPRYRINRFRLWIGLVIPFLANFFIVLFVDEFSGLPFITPLSLVSFLLFYGLGPFLPFTTSPFIIFFW